jgi:hypothetical protein
MTYLLASVSFATAAVTAIAVALEREHSNWALLAALAAAVATLVSAINQHSREKLIDKLNKEQWIETKGNLVGGDSFAVVYFPERAGTYWMMIRHFGQYQLKDIRISCINPADSNREIIRAFVYPSLFGHAIETIRPVAFNGDRFGFQITFEAPNGRWYETVKAARVNQRLVFAVRVWKIKDNETGIPDFDELFTDVHEDFPRESNGEVDWSFGTICIDGLQPDPETSEDGIRRELGMKK